MNQNEWVEYFEALNGRKPSPEEYMAALKNGEFTRDKGEASGPAIAATPVTPQTPETSVISPQPAIASPVSPQVKQSPLARLSKNAKIGIAAALLALITLGGYFFYQQHVNNLEGTWKIVKVETQRNGDTKKTVVEEAAGHLEIEGEKFDLLSYSYDKEYDEYSHIEKKSKEFGYGTVDKKTKTIITPKNSEIQSFPYEIKNSRLYLVIEDKEKMGKLYIEAERVSEARAKELKAKVKAELDKQEKEEAKWSDDEDEDYDDYGEDYHDEVEYN